MAFAGGAVPDRQPSPASSNNNNINRLTLNLSSNNPFRNRASPSPLSADATQQNFPFPNMQSPNKNPFLDPAQRSTTSDKIPVNDGNTSALADDFFKDLSLNEKPKPNFSAPLPPRGQPPRSGTLPTQNRGPEDQRRERPPPPRGPLRDPNSPEKRPEHRRRASDTSMMEKDRQERRDRRAERERGDRPPRTESEERRRRERRREREERHKAEKERIKNGGKPRKPGRNLDIIDKLDVTGVYGQGLFHHDGPFDACNPHRNAKKDRRAPMQAFPEGSMNMALGGSGPVSSQLDLDRFHGRAEEGFNDYSTTRKADTAYVNQVEYPRGQPLQYVNPTDRIEQVHGEQTHGLGTSTFLEGAPASQKALQQRELEDRAHAEAGIGGLARKKSLAQRIRGMSNTRPRPSNGEFVRSPDGRYSADENPLESPPIHSKALSAGGQARAIYTKESEPNPFDNEYDRAFDRKGATIRIAEQEKPSQANVGHKRDPSSPGGANLTRSLTSEAALQSPTEEKPSGFLGRMKSLKGGKRARPERKESSG